MSKIYRETYLSANFCCSYIHCDLSFFFSFFLLHSTLAASHSPLLYSPSLFDAERRQNYHPPTQSPHTLPSLHIHITAMAPVATSALVSQGHKVLLVGTASASPSDLTQARDSILSTVGTQGSVNFEQFDRLATSTPLSFFLLSLLYRLCWLPAGQYQ